VKDVQTLPGADIDSDHNFLVAKIYTRLKKIMRFQKRRPQWNLEKLYTQKQRVQGTLEGKRSVIECDSGNVEVQWNNIKECVLDTLSDLVGKVEKLARKPWITQEMISKMHERRRWKNVNTEEGRKNYRRLRNELKKATDNAKKEYLENVCNEITEFQRTGRNDVMYIKTKELNWKETQGIPNIGIEDSQGNRIIQQSQVLKIWRNYITELHD
jgi:type I site-specific restriction endonuclease